MKVVGFKPGVKDGVIDVQSGEFTTHKVLCQLKSYQLLENYKKSHFKTPAIRIHRKWHNLTGNT